MNGELILINGDFYTQDPACPQATAVAIRGGRYLAVDDDDHVLVHSWRGVPVIDLEGRKVLPGFTDAHIHLLGWALSRRQMSLVGVTSLADLQQRLAEQVVTTSPGRWIVGQGWNETEWPEARVPTRSDLDGVSPDHPVLLWRTDLHMAVVNSCALERAGLTVDTPDPTGGVVGRDAQGELNGVLCDTAVSLVTSAIPTPTEDEALGALREGFCELHRLGLTGVHAFPGVGGASGPLGFRVYQRLEVAGELSTRVWMLLPGENLDEAIALGLRTGMGSDMLRVGHLKFFADGSQGARTAWMSEPYEDAPGCGLPIVPAEELAEATRRADRAGLAVAIHAIGDQANHALIRALEPVLKDRRGAETVLPAAPHRIEHAQMLRTEDVLHMARLGLVGSVQPIHATDDIPMIERSVGVRSRLAYPFSDMQRAGVTLAFGSDGPVADINPFYGVHAAVTRQRRDGTPAGGWYPAQRLSVAEAVRGYTFGPAIASGRRADLGSIAPGKLADLIVLDRDIFAIPPEEIAETQVVMTVVGGDVVYRR